MSIVGWTAALGNECVPEIGLKQDRVDLNSLNTHSKADNGDAMQLDEAEDINTEQEIIVVHVENEQTPVSNKKQKNAYASKRNADEELHKFQNETMEVLREISMGIQNLNIELKNISQSLEKIAIKYDSSF